MSSGAIRTSRGLACRKVRPCWRRGTWSQPFAQPPGIDALPGIQPTSERNAVPIYDFANQRVVLNALERLPVRTGTLRAIGGFLNTFAIECFMDELAHAAGVDPVELRLSHLGDERAIAVIKAARERSGLASRSRHDGSGGDGSRGMGLGFARYSNEAAYAAVVVEVEAGETIKVVRAVAAVDCGRTINPDGVKQPDRGRYRAGGELGPEGTGAVRPDPHHHADLGRLSDPALQRVACRSRSPSSTGRTSLRSVSARRWPVRSRRRSPTRCSTRSACACAICH